MQRSVFVFAGRAWYCSTMVGWPVVGTMLSVASLQSLESRLVFPEPVRPIQTTSYSGLGGGGPLQHNVLKHWRRVRKKVRKVTTISIKTSHSCLCLCDFFDLRFSARKAVGVSVCHSRNRNTSQRHLTSVDTIWMRKSYCKRKNKSTAQCLHWNHMSPKSPQCSGISKQHYIFLPKKTALLSVSHCQSPSADVMTLSDNANKKLPNKFQQSRVELTAKTHTNKETP